MNTPLTDVVVHIDETLSEDALHTLEQGVREDEGVVSIGHSSGQKHLLMMVYDADVTHAATLLHRFQRHGLHAQLIGF